MLAACGCIRKFESCIVHQKKALAYASAFFNEINPYGICEICFAYEIAGAMKYAAAYEGFILFHFLRQQKIS